MIDIEHDIRAVLHSQAEALDTPSAEPGSFRVALTAPPSPPRRSVLVAIAAAVVASAVGVTGWAMLSRRADPVAAPPAPAFRMATPTVLLEADLIEVVTPAGRTSPGTDVDVDSDPGTIGRYTTLELTWFDGGREQRLYVYFESDGVTWWASEIRAYDGSVDGDWMEPAATGRFFERPVGEAFIGAIDLPNLRVEGLRLEAFRHPAACGAAAQGPMIVADYPVIDESIPVGSSESSGFGATFQVFDAATCTPLPTDDFEFAYEIDDPSVATAVQVVPEGEQEKLGKAHVNIVFHGPGSTTLRVVARSSSSGFSAVVEVPILLTSEG